MWVFKFVCTHNYMDTSNLLASNIRRLSKMWIFKSCGYSIYVGIQICLYSKLYGCLNLWVRKMWVPKIVGI